MDVFPFGFSDRQRYFSLFLCKDVSVLDPTPTLSRRANVLEQCKARHWFPFKEKPISSARASTKRPANRLETDCRNRLPHFPVGATKDADESRNTEGRNIHCCAQHSPYSSAASLLSLTGPVPVHSPAGAF